MLLPPRKLVGLLVASTLPTACALQKIDSDYQVEAHAGQAGNSGSISAAKAGNSGTSKVTSAVGPSGGATVVASSSVGGRTTLGGSSSSEPTTAGATATITEIGGSASGGSNAGGAISTGSTFNGGATSTTVAGATSGGATTRPAGGNTGRGGSSVAGATNATGGTSSPATGGVANAGSGGQSTAITTGGSSVAGAGALGGATATGGWVSVAGALNTPLVPTKITTGFYTSCAVKGDGTAYCWGTEYCGALGNDSDGGGTQPCGFTGWYIADDFLHVTLQHSPVQVHGVSNAVAIGRGVANMHNCVLRSGGTVSCWGWNAEGELGNDGAGSWSTLPVAVKNLSNVVSVVLGSDHSCALLADATVKCWGDNVDGAIGNGDPCSSGSCSDTLATPVLVAAGTPLDQVHSIFSGAYHTCALKTDGSVWCWGYNAKGQLGNGTIDDGRFATRANFPPALDVVTGSQFTCVRAVDDALWCAGYNEYGGFGSEPPTPDPAAPVPTPVRSLTFTSPLVAMAAGTYNACAVVSSVEGSANVAQCWGDNWTGQLGNGTIDSSLAPVSALGMNNVTEIAADSNHTCAVRAGSVYCWGNNDAGQIGTTTTGRILEPTKVEGLQL